MLAGLVASCGDDYRDFDASVMHDAGVEDEGVSLDGGIPVGASFTMVGCDALVFDSGSRPLCTTTRNRPLTFVPLSVGVESVVWTFPGATPSSSTVSSPAARWTSLGTFTVSLATGGGGGTAVGSGAVRVVAAGAAAVCLSDADCDASVGLSCLCSSGTSCPAALAAGLCARRCETTPCIAGEVCADLTRAGSASPPDAGEAPDGGATDAFRVRLCVPTCSAVTSCRTGFACAELPVNSAGSPPGAPYSWQSACFAPVLGAVGTACRNADGTPDDSRCASGHCEGLGAQGVCSGTCDDDNHCPTNAVCATVPSIGGRCLMRCSTTTDCGDVLMACKGPATGGLGFSLPSGVSATTTLCAPKRCTVPADCGLAGTCTVVGSASYCLRD